MSDMKLGQNELTADKTLQKKNSELEIIRIKKSKTNYKEKFEKMNKTLESCGNTSNILIFV